MSGGKNKSPPPKDPDPKKQEVESSRAELRAMLDYFDDRVAKLASIMVEIKKD